MGNTPLGTKTTAQDTKSNWTWGMFDIDIGTPQPPEPPQTQPTMMIRNKANGFCMKEGGNENNESGLKLVMDTCNVRDPKQNFRVDRNQGMVYATSVANRCMDDGGGLTGSIFHLWPCDSNNTNQRFGFYDDGTIKNRLASEPQTNIRCMDAGANNRANIGSQYQLYDCYDGRGTQQFELVPNWSSICTGSTAVQTDPRCISYCESIQNNAAMIQEATQCKLDKWQRGYCNNDLILNAQNATCMDYCNPGRMDINVDTNDWCTSKRRDLCATRERTLKANMLAKNDDDSKQAYKDLITSQACACYLPESVYTEYVDDMKRKMGLKSGQQDMIITFLEANKKCMYPPCATTRPEFRPFVCPALQLCIQNIDVDIQGSTITGSSDVNAAMNCFNSIQSTRKCNHSYGPWTDCVDGTQTRIGTPTSDSDSGCQPSKETQKCESATTPSTPPPPTNPTSPPIGTTTSSTSYITAVYVVVVVCIILFILFFVIYVVALN